MADVTAHETFAAERRRRMRLPGGRLAWLIDTFVFTAILLVTAAIAIGLMDHGEMPAHIAFIAGSGLLATLVALHLLIRRVQAVGAMRAAIDAVEADFQAKAATAAPMPAEADHATHAAAPSLADVRPEAADAPHSVSRAATAPPSPPEPPMLAARSIPAPPVADATREPVRAEPAVADPSWSMRPSELKMESSVPDAAQPKAVPDALVVDRTSGDVAAINALLKRMAADIAPERARATSRDEHARDAAPPPPAETIASVTAAPPAEHHTTEPVLEAPVTRPSLGAGIFAGLAAGARGSSTARVSHEPAHVSVAATGAARELRTDVATSAVAMEDDAAALATALARGTMEPPQAAPERDPQAVIASIAAALANERVDVFLEPIKNLESRAAADYEVTLRLKLDDAEAAERAAYSEAASGTPLLPLIDTMAVAHSRRVVWRLVDNCHDGRVMTTISGESLVSDQFHADFGEIALDGDLIASRLLLSFPQHDVRLFSHRQGLALAKLQAQGFRFVLDYVADLDMDFESLVDDGLTGAHRAAGR
ncbi:MAG: EAL domain-containing protein, partial [Pseudomonadota bacterium]